MSKIIQFPKTTNRATGVTPLAPPVGVHTNPAITARGNTALTGITWLVWVTVSLFWPVIKWVLSIDVVFQFIRMVYYWDSSGIHAGWAFMLHFTMLTALTYFVSFYKPNGL